MKRTVAVVALTAGLTIFTAGAGSAQYAVFGTGGLVVPTGDFGDAANTGWLVSGGVGRVMNEAQTLSLIGEVMYGAADGEGAGPDHNLFGVMGHLEYYLPIEAPVSTSVFAGAGYLERQREPDVGPKTTDEQGAVNFGVGLGLPVSTVQVFVIGRYLAGFDDLNFFNVQGGIAIPIGGGGM